MRLLSFYLVQNICQIILAYKLTQSKRDCPATLGEELLKNDITNIFNMINLDAKKLPQPKLMLFALHSQKLKVRPVMATT
jgi:hypothetical protein